METGQGLSGVTRRRFFEGLAAAGGVGLAMSGMEALGFGFQSSTDAPPALTGGKSAKVIILGAGLAGLTAAYELTQAGYQVQLLESRSFAGGRSQTTRGGRVYTDILGHTQVCQFDEGQYLNNGPWRIPYHHRSTLYYTKKFSVPLEVLVNDNDAAYCYFEGGKGPLVGKPVRKGQIAADARGKAAELLAKVASRGDLDGALTPDDKERFLAYLVNEGRLSTKDLTYTGTEGRGYAVRPGPGMDPGPGKESTPFALSDILGSETWSVLTSVAEFDQQRTMFQPVGGMDQIARGFAKQIGHLIRYEAKVEQVRQTENGVQVVYKDALGDEITVAADYCICTIPLSVLRQVDVNFAPAFKSAISEVAYAPVNKIGLQMKRRFWEEDHFIYGGHVYNDIPGVRTISLPSYGFQGQKGVILGYYAFEKEAVKVSALTPEARIKFALAAGQKVFPEYTEAFENGFSFSWHLEKHNLGGWADWTDDSRKSAYPVLVEPDNRIYLAGEHLTYIGGWQAAAIESAWQQIGKLHARVQKA